MVVFDEMFGLVDRGTPGVRGGAVVADVAREVAWLEGMVTTLEPAFRSRTVRRGLPEERDEADVRDWRRHRVWRFERDLAAHQLQDENSRQRLVECVKSKVTGNPWSPTVTLVMGVDWRERAHLTVWGRLASLAPCHTVVAAGHAKRLAREGGP